MPCRNFAKELGRKKKALNHALSMTVTPENWEELLTYARDTLPEHKVPTRVSAPPRAKGMKQQSVSPR